MEITPAVDKGQERQMDINMTQQRKNTLIRMIAMGKNMRHTLATLTKTGNIVKKGVHTTLTHSRRTIVNTGPPRISTDSAPTLRRSSARAGILVNMTDNKTSINGAHTTSTIENTASMSKNSTDSRKISSGNSRNNRSVLVRQTLAQMKKHKKL